MELKLQPPFFTIILTVLVVMLPGVLLAQESELVPREYHPIETHTSAPSNETIENEELIVEEEKRSNSFIAKDSIMVKSPATSKSTAKTKNNSESQRSLTDQKPTEKNNEDQKKEDSILSFNFLYYIFQKFKLSDIVDK